MNLAITDPKTQSARSIFVLLVVFFLLKIIHVSTPLFHDELGVYGRAFFYMLDNGPTMVPGAVDPEISRGHPLFFAFFIGWVGTLFGGTFVAVRVAILFLSLGLLYATYQLGKELNNAFLGLLAAILLALQPIFFAQSTLILPEIMLSLFGTLSLLYYIRKQYLAYFIFASLLVLTKETAVVILAGIGLNEWVQNKFKIDINLVKNGIKWMLPISCLFVFLTIQKIQHGWFLYPYHTDFISFSIDQILIRLLLTFAFLFLAQGRFLLTFAVLLFLYRLPKEQRAELLRNNALFCLVILAMLVFSCVNYFMPRYLLLVLPLLMVFYVSFLEKLGYTKIKHLVVFFLATLPFQYSFYEFRNDDDMGYLIVVRSMQQSIEALDKETNGKPVKVFAHFPEINALEDPRNGYTTNPNYTMTNSYDTTVQYIVKSHNYQLVSNETVNNVIDNPEMRVYGIINNQDSLRKYGMELLYEKKSFFNTQRIFRTNN